MDPVSQMGLIRAQSFWGQEPSKTVKVLVTFMVTLCNPMEYSPPGSSAHGIFQARILEWVAIPFSRGSSQPRVEPRSPELQADSLLSEPPGKSLVEQHG